MDYHFHSFLASTGYFDSLSHSASCSKPAVSIAPSFLDSFLASRGYLNSLKSLCFLLKASSIAPSKLSWLPQAHLLFWLEHFCFPLIRSLVITLYSPGKSRGISSQYHTINLICPCTFSRVWLFATIWTVAHQVRQEYRSGLPFPPPGDILNTGTGPEFPALAGGLFTTGKPPVSSTKTHL